MDLNKSPKATRTQTNQVRKYREKGDSIVAQGRCPEIGTLPQGQ